VALAALIGWAYSRPPFYFKKHHLSAALSIVLVRGVLINVGGYMVFRELLGKDTDLSMNMLVLSAFVIIYTFVISWFKDLSDVKGDSAFKIKTLAIVWTPKLVLRLGVFSVGFAYVSSILMFMILCYFDYYFNTNHKEWVLLWGHLVLFVLFIINAFQIKLKDVDSIRRFYKRFWLFFFAEYLLFLFAYVFFY
jgi:homogentisate phytyltransferase/homogentisate geranylgeranyltransferase